MGINHLVSTPACPVYSPETKVSQAPYETKRSLVELAFGLAGGPHVSTKQICNCLSAKR
ncbi:hypothetical protein PAXRUDRAFT_240744 [Paxillus rubicundulus Ve08.2h10]|uniref:Uncharacterized protein n=1 Tax=Paxillus rubicundulus Ve08.2h10 TaxID=930991 RepID=A0A0D0CBV4_9AGAM|nr:hypothetical protein PAXRUDRAFT_240744 [Paxillus rubicundulus Ve08.2h10]